MYFDVFCPSMPYCSISEDDGHESGCETVDGSPPSDSSLGPHDSPFPERRFLTNHNQNQEPQARRGHPNTRLNKPAVRTVVVPPMRVLNNNHHPNSEHHMANTGMDCPYVEEQLQL